MSAHDKLPRTSFSGIEFPVEQHTLHGRGRHHVHVYSHVPKGAPEKLGPDLYNLSVRAPFHDRFPSYPNLYPGSLNALRALFETQITAKFVHPTVGSFDAFIVDWRQVKASKTRSGELVDIEFLEDQQTAFLVDAISKPSQSTIATSAAQLDRQLLQILDQLKFGHNDVSVFDAIQSAANAVLAVQDTSKMYGNLLAAKVTQLGNLCAQADRLSSLQDPLAWPVVDALHDLWSAAVRVAQDLHNNQVPVATWNVPQAMTMGQVTIAIYGDTARESDLLSLNSDRVPNPLNVPVGTPIRYYPS